MPVSSFGCFDFVNFYTVPISFSLMSLLRDSKGKPATLAFPDRRLASLLAARCFTVSAFLTSHIYTVFLLHETMKPNCFYQADHYNESLFFGEFFVALLTYSFESPKIRVLHSYRASFSLYSYVSYPCRVKPDPQVHPGHLADRDMR